MQYFQVIGDLVHDFMNFKALKLFKNSKKNSIRDARTPQPGEIFLNTMKYI